MELINPIVRRWRQEASDDPDAFWGRAAEQLPWFRKWDKVFDWQYPTFQWFVGGRTNLAYNCLDHHVAQGRGGQAALIYANERGERQVFTYAQMKHEVVRIAAALRGMGIQRGDRVAIYMPLTPEAVMLMLAIVRIGAIHMVVFAGFGAGALAERIKASGARLLFAADVTLRKGKDVPLKGLVDAALAQGCDSIERCIVLRRRPAKLSMQAGRDIDWHEFLAHGAGQSGAHVELESNEAAFILATSGTTAKPKLAVHAHGGYQVHIHSMGRWVFGLKPGDVWWSTSDIGWIVGHSYIVYAPLLAGCATIAYEGSLDHPDAATFWQIIEQFGVTGAFTSPTLVRLLMRYGEEPARRHSVESLQRLFCAGEVLNAPAWEWLQTTVLHDRIPVIDHMWQTETAGPIFGNPYGVCLLPIKPGSATIPLAGIEAAVVDAEGEPCAPNEKGIMVIKRPFPGLIARLWGEPERYGRDYWEQLPAGSRPSPLGSGASPASPAGPKGHAARAAVREAGDLAPGVYYTGDSAHIDADGYVWFAGRADEIIKIAGHRIGTIEVETAFMKNPAVAEAGVTGRPDALRMEVISAFIVLKQGRQPSEQLRKELLDTVRAELGPVAVVGELNFVNMLPKTRSGKIMRRVLKAVTLGKDPGDITTIEDEGSVGEALHAWEAMRIELEGAGRNKTG